MKPLFILLVAGHGLIHLMGPAKAFGWAELPQLTQPISKATAVVWLLAALALLASAGAVVFWPRWWWVIGAIAIAISQSAILTS